MLLKQNFLLRKTEKTVLKSLSVKQGLHVKPLFLYLAYFYVAARKGLSARRYPLCRVIFVFAARIIDGHHARSGAEAVLSVVEYLCRIEAVKAHGPYFL